MRGKIQLLLTIMILASVLTWIVLSYVPSSLILLPQLQSAPAGLMRLYPVLSIGSLLLFVALQVWLVLTTARSVRRYRNDAYGPPSTAFSLSVPREALLTALPIGFTILLAVAAHGWWQKLLTLF